MKKGQKKLKEKIKFQGMEIDSLNDKMKLTRVSRRRRAE